MNRALLTVVSLGLAVGVSPAAEEPKFVDTSDKVSYSVGYQVGGDFKRQEVEIKPGAFLKGVQDALEGAEPAIPSEEMGQVLADLKKRVAAVQMAQKRQAGEKNLAKGKAFLEENAKKEGVTTLPSDLQYRVMTEGEGDSPRATDTVTVHYRGTLIDGTEFDSSYSRGKPATFQLNRVIKGWTEGVQLMKPGAKYRFFIPSELAYGQRGAGAKIGPNSALIFDVELISVQ